MKSRILPLILLLLFAAGCADLLALNPDSIYNRKDVLATWQGAHISELIASWGQPAPTIADSDPGKAGWRDYYWSQNYVEQDCNWVVENEKTGQQSYVCEDWREFDCTYVAHARPDGLIDSVTYYGDCGAFRAPKTRQAAGKDKIK